MVRWYIMRLSERKHQQWQQQQYYRVYSVRLHATLQFLPFFLPIRFVAMAAIGWHCIAWQLWFFSTHFFMYKLVKSRWASVNWLIKWEASPLAHSPGAILMNVIAAFGIFSMFLFLLHYPWLSWTWDWQITIERIDPNFIYVFFFEKW